jgi:hypothetical protein
MEIVGVPLNATNKFQTLRENQTAVKGGKWRIVVVSNGHFEIHEAAARWH